MLLMEVISVQLAASRRFKQNAAMLQPEPRDSSGQTSCNPETYPEAQKDNLRRPILRSIRESEPLILVIF